MNSPKRSTATIALPLAILIITWAANCGAMYDPSLQRWINRDPIQELAFSRNLFCFTLNSPANIVDLYGLVDSKGYPVYPPPDVPMPPYVPQSQSAGASDPGPATARLACASPASTAAHSASNPLLHL